MRRCPVCLKSRNNALLAPGALLCFWCEMAELDRQRLLLRRLPVITCLRHGSKECQRCKKEK